MSLPPIPRWLVGYALSFALSMLFIHYLESQASWKVIQEIIDAQIQHGIQINVSTSFPKLDPFDTSTYLHQDSVSHPPNPFISPLMHCPHTPDATTSHIRLPIYYLNISLTPPSSSSPFPGQHFNPTFLRLPSWAIKSPTANGAKYILVTRVVTEGLHQESLICLADICLPPPSPSPNNPTPNPLPPDTRPCTPADTPHLSPHGGMRCTVPPIKLNIPPTPAHTCTGAWSSFPSIAGFHDPRIFWSNRGEPLIILNSASAYGCVGLWLLDLRTVYPALDTVLSRERKRKRWEGPLLAYRRLTEVGRVHGRGEVEKNWMLFFPGGEYGDGGGEMVVQYDAVPRYEFADGNEWESQLTTSMNDSLAHTKRTPPSTAIGTKGGRSLALLIGAGHATPDLLISSINTNTNTSNSSESTSTEQTCFPPSTLHDINNHTGNYHQATNSLKLILCTRQQYKDGLCDDAKEWTRSGREVHFAIMHRKFSNELKLPMRYERYVVVWEGRKPYKVVGVGKWAVVFGEEVVRILAPVGGSSDGGGEGEKREGNGDGGLAGMGKGGMSVENGSFDGGWRTEMSEQRLAKRETAMKGIIGKENVEQGQDQNKPLPAPFNNEASPLDAAAALPPPPPPPPPLHPPRANESRIRHGDFESTDSSNKPSIEDDDVDPTGNTTSNPHSHPPLNAYFTYTPSLSWAWRPIGDHFSPSSDTSPSRSPSHNLDSTTNSIEYDNSELSLLNTGFLDDTLLLGIGLDDTSQVFVRVQARELVGCLRWCGEV